MRKFWRIEAVYSGEGTAVTTYKVVDEFGRTQFQGSHTDCYYYLHPKIDNSFYDNPTGHGDICYSDADPGL